MSRKNPVSQQSRKQKRLFRKELAQIEPRRKKDPYLISEARLVHQVARRRTQCL